MAEVRVRLIDCRDRITYLRKLTPPDIQDSDYFEFELCCFHLRMICEAVASGCLVLHHHLGIDSRTLNEWHAGEAIKRLGKINDRCFPRAVTMKLGGSGYTLNLETNRLTFAGMNSLYGQLGDVLHRGKVAKTIARKRRYDLGKLLGWYNDLGRLLEKHVIIIRQTAQFFVTDLFGGDEGGVKVYLMQGRPSGFATTPD